MAPVCSRRGLGGGREARLRRLRRPPRPIPSSSLLENPRRTSRSATSTARSSISVPTAALVPSSLSSAALPDCSAGVSWTSWSNSPGSTRGGSNSSSFTVKKPTVRASPIRHSAAVSPKKCAIPHPCNDVPSWTDSARTTSLAASSSFSRTIRWWSWISMAGPPARWSGRIRRQSIAS